MTSFPLHPPPGTPAPIGRRGPRGLASIIACAGFVGAFSSSICAATPEPSVTLPDASFAATLSTATSLGDLGLALLRDQTSRGGTSQRNTVVSTVSLAAALGMVQQGAGGASASEIAALVGSPIGGTNFFATRWPLLAARLASDGAEAGALLLASRLWLDTSVAGSVSGEYLSVLRERYRADEVVLSFGQPAAATDEINRWVADRTGGRITQLVTPAAIQATTRIVATSAVAFKSPWARPFDPRLTTPRPFESAPGRWKPVPTLVDDREVQTAHLDRLTVMELPFAGDAFGLLIAMPTEGHSLAELEAGLDGVNLLEWRRSLKPTRCRFALPRFALTTPPISLKPALQAMGVHTVFSSKADLRPMLGAPGASVRLGDILQRATVVIDEQGGEAAAATGAVVVAKSIELDLAPCAVDRPFLFAIVHRASGAPLFVGQVVDPAS